MFVEYVIIIASIIGVIVSSFVNENKRTGRHICPINSKSMDCEGVTSSEYNNVFGIPLELMGIFYYLVIGSMTIISMAMPLAIEIKTFLFLVSFAAFLISIFLTFVQVFRLKRWCFWCIGSAIMSTIIFAASAILILQNLPEVSQVFAQYKLLFIVLHLLGFAFGLGGATFSDIFFFKFLKDFKISNFENNTLETFSRFIWIGLFLAYISGIALFLGNYTALAASSKFLLKVIVVIVVTINGAFLTLLISPNLTNIHFIGKIEAKKLHKLRRLAFAMGGVSIVSWYSAFILGTLKSIPLPLGTLLAIYGLLLTVAVSVTQIIEHALTHKQIEK